MSNSLPVRAHRIARFLIVFTLSFLTITPAFAGGPSCQNLIDNVNRGLESQAALVESSKEVENLAFHEILGFTKLSSQEQKQVLEHLENQAISSLEMMVKPNLDVQQTLGVWIKGIEDRLASSGQMTVMEHTALTYLLSKDFFKSADQSLNMQIQIENMLKQSWLRLTGEEVHSDELLRPLPLKIRMRMSRQELIFHQASFQPSGRIVKSTGQSKGRLGAAAGLVIAAAFHFTGSDTMSGLVIGYLGATLSEHIVHKYFGHSNPRVKSMTQRLGWLGRTINATVFSHNVVHHGLTYKKNHVTQFADAEAEAALIKQLQDHYKIGDSELSGLIRSKYGASLTDEGVLQGLAMTAPVYLSLSYLMGFDSVGTLALMAPTAAYIGLSKVVHPYVHMTRTEMKAKAPLLVRWFLTSRYGEWMSRHHWIHHNGGGGNYNLLHLGNLGGDAMLGDLRSPNLETLFRMREEDLVGARWD